MSVSSAVKQTKKTASEKQYNFGGFREIYDRKIGAQRNSRFSAVRSR